MKVEVVLATAERNWCVELDIVEGTNVTEALALAFASNVFDGANRVRFDAIGVWGKVVSADYVLQDQDRVELLRRLSVDPLARRKKLSQID